MIILKRWYNNDCTLGRMSIGGFRCFTLELPDFENKQNVSCIPEGVYNYFLRYSSRNGMVLELVGVQGRSFIQIHAGNFTRQIRGCILVGSAIKYIDSDSTPDVAVSKMTLGKLLDVAGNSGQITIGS